MTKANITQYDSTPSNNADINDINIAENCPASNINNAIRELMAHLKNVDTGSQALTALSVTGNVTVAGDIQKTSGNLTVDVAGTISLDADSGSINLLDGGTTHAELLNSSNDFVIKSSQSDKDIIFKGVDGGSLITAMTIDMSEGGKVGIGTTAPSTTLHVRGADDTSTLTVGNTTENTALAIRTLQDDRVVLRSEDGGTNRSMAFETGTTERMRIHSSSGNLSIGNTDDVAGIKVFRHLQSYNAISLQNGTNNDGQIFQSFLRSSGSVVGSISQTAGGAQILFNTSSDYRLKENVSYDFNATSRLKQLKPARFNWIEDDTNTTFDGFLAHEVSSVVPEAITGKKDGTQDLGTVKDKDDNIIEKNVSETHFKERQKETVDLDGNKEDPAYPSTHKWEKTKTENVYQQIDQSKLVPLLTKALQEQQATIEALTARITALENA